MIIFIIRALPVVFGLHTIVALLLIVVVITKTTKVLASRSFIAVFTAAVCLSILELTSHEILFALFKTDLSALSSLQWDLAGMPQAVLMVVFAVLVAKYRKPDQDAWKAHFCVKKTGGEKREGVQF